VKVIESKKNALAIAKAACGKKAHDIILIDMRNEPSVCDYFVIASGKSTTQVRAITDNIVKKLREKGERVWHAEGEREALWIVLDYGDVVAHVFYEETRRFYDLERLWADSPQRQFKEPEKPRKAVAPSARKKKTAR